MLLNRSDLEQMDEAHLRRLSPEQLLAVNARLLQDVKESHDRLNQNARNSSVPPSRQPAYLESGALAPGEDPKAKPDGGKEDGEADERRAGKPEGAPEYGRMQILPPH